MATGLMIDVGLSWHLRENASAAGWAEEGGGGTWRGLVLQFTAIDIGHHPSEGRAVWYC